VDAPAGRILRVISFEQLRRDAAADNGCSRSREGPKAVSKAARKQPGTVSNNSEVFWPTPRIPALEGDIPAVFLLQTTAGTAKSGKENGRAYSSRYLIEQP
jgi:hypothetical protein